MGRHVRARDPVAHPLGTHRRTPGGRSPHLSVIRQFPSSLAAPNFGSSRWTTGTDRKAWTRRRTATASVSSARASRNATPPGRAQWTKIAVGRGIKVVRRLRPYHSPMRKLEGISTERLRTALDDADEAKAATRLVVALAYKDGVHVETLVERYGIPQSTIDDWLDRLENQPLADALRDEPRPGRPPKLSAEQRVEVETWLDGSPRDVGYDSEEWTAEPCTSRSTMPSTSRTPRRTSTGCFPRNRLHSLPTGNIISDSNRTQSIVLRSA